jgi:hypothetical protein
MEVPQEAYVFLGKNPKMIALLPCHRLPLPGCDPPSSIQFTGKESHDGRDSFVCQLELNTQHTLHVRGLGGIIWSRWCWEFGYSLAYSCFGALGWKPGRVCFIQSYCRTYSSYKAQAVRVGGGGEWRTCATRDDEPRPVWTTL